MKLHMRQVLLKIYRIVQSMQRQALPFFCNSNSKTSNVKKIYSHLNNIDKKIRICFRLYSIVIFYINDAQLNGFHRSLVHHLVIILVFSNLFFVVCDMNQNESSERRFRIEMHQQRVDLSDIERNATSLRAGGEREEMRSRYIGETIIPL